jgi:hypothetical protein
VFALEKRGYVKAGPWTPEATVEHPEAGSWRSFTEPILIFSPLLRLDLPTQLSVTSLIKKIEETE